MASIVGKAIKGFGKALKYHKAKRAASKKVHFDFQKGKPFPKKTQEHIRNVEKRLAHILILFLSIKYKINPIGKK